MLEQISAGFNWGNLISVHVYCGAISHMTRITASHNSRYLFYPPRSPPKSGQKKPKITKRCLSGHCSAMGCAGRCLPPMGGRPLSAIFFAHFFAHPGPPLPTFCILDTFVEVRGCVPPPLWLGDAGELKNKNVRIQGFWRLAKRPATNPMSPNFPRISSYSKKDTKKHCGEEAYQLKSGKGRNATFFSARHPPK